MSIMKGLKVLIGGRTDATTSTEITVAEPAQSTGTDLRSFSFNQSQIRTLTIDGEPWFVARDVATVLGYVDSVNAIKAHCKGVVKRHLVTEARGLQEIATIPERDLYRLIMRSRLPAAEQFEEWVVGTVLPAIRKHGGYIAGQEKLRTGEMSREEVISRGLVAALSSIEEADRLRLLAETKTIELEGVVEEMAPKVALVEEHFGDERLQSISDFCRTLDGVNSNAVKGALAAEPLKFLYKGGRSGRYRVYSRYLDREFFEKRNDRSGDMDIFLRLPLGGELMTRLYLEGRLPMKKDFLMVRGKLTRPAEKTPRYHNQTRTLPGH